MLQWNTVCLLLLSTKCVLHNVTAILAIHWRSDKAQICSCYTWTQDWASFADRGAKTATNIHTHTPVHTASAAKVVGVTQRTSFALSPRTMRTTLTGQMDGRYDSWNQQILCTQIASVPHPRGWWITLRWRQQSSNTAMMCAIDRLLFWALLDVDWNTANKMLSPICFSTPQSH